jgi:hypothetical protein
VNTIAQEFLRSGDIVLSQAPQPPKLSSLWVEVEPIWWEFAEWVTAGVLQSILGDRLAHGSVVATSSTAASEEVTQAIVRQVGTFVALLDASNVFQGLCDRGAIVEKVACSAVEQAIST